MSDDFKQGQQDCEDGIPFFFGKSKEYERGYGYQYELEELGCE